MTMHCGDAVQWANDYSGPLHHAMLCDPPYHLSDPRDMRRASPSGKQREKIETQRGGFMNCKRDGGDVAFRAETWAAFMRVLHPGAYPLALCTGGRLCMRCGLFWPDGNVPLKETYRHPPPPAVTPHSLASARGGGRGRREVFTVKFSDSLDNYIGLRDVEAIGKLLELAVRDFVEPHVKLISRRFLV